MSSPGGASLSRDRLAREIEHHRRIADRAEAIWNWDSPAGRARARRRAEFFVSAGALGPGSRALELGCGTGVFLRQVAPCGAHITGVDLSWELLAQARDRLRPFPAVTLEYGNAEDLPHGDGTFDAVYGSSILHHLDLDRAVREVFRVLRPGGRLAFTEPNILNPQVALMFHVRSTREYFGVSPDEMAFSRWRARNALVAAGFVECSVTPFDFLHPSVPASLVGPVAAVGRLLERVPVAREISGSFQIRAVRP